MPRSKKAQKAMEWVPDPLTLYKVGILCGAEVREFEVYANAYRCCDGGASFWIELKSKNKGIADFTNVLWIVESAALSKDFGKVDGKEF